MDDGDGVGVELYGPVFEEDSPGGAVVELEVGEVQARELADGAAGGGYEGGQGCVVIRPDGSLSVRDDGRGTDACVDEHGQYVKKPVMATKDLRFFDFPQAEVLPDGHPGAACPWLRCSARGSAIPIGVSTGPGLSATNTAFRHRT
ncbi:hypothetical protein [Streptomyces sp. NPDC002054]|uniref:hypothetical protein n=1 Tax=Streptomyces sp. NPDC002054 TaxID=3154663 RepID=UPI003324B6B3